MASKSAVFLTPFHRAELVNAVFSYVFRRQISTRDAQLALANFERDCLGGLWAQADLPQRVFSTCEVLATRHVATLGVRTLDTLHVAAALELKATAFWTFDQRQERLAEAEGLPIT